MAPERRDRVDGVLRHLHGGADMRAALNAAIKATVTAPVHLVSVRSIENAVAAVAIAAGGAVDTDTVRWATAPEMAAKLGKARGRAVGANVGRLAVLIADSGAAPAPGWAAAAATFVSRNAAELSLSVLATSAFALSRLWQPGGSVAHAECAGADEHAALAGSLQRELLLRCVACPLLFAWRQSHRIFRRCGVILHLFRCPRRLWLQAMLR